MNFTFCFLQHIILFQLQINVFIYFILFRSHNLKFECGVIADESLADFVEEAARHVEEQGQKVVMFRQKKRKQFIFELLKRLGRSVVSYDALKCQYASFLLDSDGFMCVLSVSLSPFFPSEPPQYRLLSVYSTATEGPLSQTLKIVYSSWEVNGMVEQALNLIRHKFVPAFQRVCVQMFQRSSDKTVFKG